MEIRYTFAEVTLVAVLLANRMLFYQANGGDVSHLANLTNLALWNVQRR